MARNNYYNNGYSPHMLFDGDIDGGSIPDTWQAIINAERYVSSPAIIELWGYYNPDSLSGRLFTRIITESNPGLSNIKLRIALIESELYRTAPNGTLIHNQVLRDMIPSAGGQGVTLTAGDSLEYSFAFEVGSPMVADKCEFVVFLQSDQNRNTIQAARIAIPDLIQVGVDDSPLIPVAFAVSQNYPNPFNSKTLIGFTLPQAGYVDIHVYSVTGQIIETLGAYFDAGNHSVAWDASQAVSGIYFCKISSGNHNQTLKMTLVK
jgi:hypothetical protein